jgi:ElaB/YqjD/DUF883 family membrane-anchored ribosome-binding protein
MANRFGEEKDVDIRADDPVRPEWERDAKQAAELAEDAGMLAEDAGMKAGQAVGKAAGEASRKLRRATDRATAAYERTAEGASHAYRSVREYALDHPGTAVAVTFGAGVVCGMSFARRRAIDEYRLGMVPTIAIALASAVLDVFSTRR